MANQATYDDANLLLRLYELRRDETMRKARQWLASFSATNPEHIQKLADRGSQENAYFRMVTSYWDMAASFVTSGVLNEELFLQNNGELLFVWEKSRPAIEQSRAVMKNPNYMKNFETVAQAAIKRMSPENYESWAAMVHGTVAATRA
jgi:L-rhamnose mutarotase